MIAIGLQVEDNLQQLGVDHGATVPAAQMLGVAIEQRLIDTGCRSSRQRGHVDPHGHAGGRLIGSTCHRPTLLRLRW